MMVHSKIGWHTVFLYFHGVFCMSNRYITHTTYAYYFISGHFVQCMHDKCSRTQLILLHKSLVRVQFIYNGYGSSLHQLSLTRQLFEEICAGVLVQECECTLYVVFKECGFISTTYVLFT